jgi:hypothetical protein
MPTRLFFGGIKIQVLVELEFGASILSFVAKGCWEGRRLPKTWKDSTPSLLGGKFSN